MSDTIPTLKIGDRVRVMQTEDAISMGLDNKKGIVAQLGPPYGILSGKVLVVFYDASPMLWVSVGTLMKHEISICK